LWKNTGGKISCSLRPPLETGANKAVQAAPSIVSSWSSKNKRGDHDGGRGLYYSIYYETVRNAGVNNGYTSICVDVNQELCDPLEKDISRNWQQTMDTSLKTYLSEAEGDIASLFTQFGNSLFSADGSTGVPQRMLMSIRTTMSRNCASVLRTAFAELMVTASSCQHDLIRSLRSKVQQKMANGYKDALNVQGGTGIFARMNVAMTNHTGKVVHSMFSDSIQELLKAIDDMVRQLADKITARTENLLKVMESALSILWEDQTTKDGFIDNE
jgi:hypothetical protein